MSNAQTLVPHKVLAFARGLRLNDEGCGIGRSRPMGTVPVLADVDANEARRRLPREPGEAGVDVDGVVQLVHRISRLAEDMPEVAELDCNPVIATPDGVLVVDARIRLDYEPARSDLEDIRYLR